MLLKEREGVVKRACKGQEGGGGKAIGAVKDGGGDEEKMGRAGSMRFYMAESKTRYIYFPHSFFFQSLFVSR